jgi:PAS domain-containing protein
MELMSIVGNTIQANRTALDLTGKEERDVKGNPFWETPWFSHSPELQDQLRAAIKKAARREFIGFKLPIHQVLGVIIS